MITGSAGLFHQFPAAVFIAYGDQHQVWLELCGLLHRNDRNRAKGSGKTGIPQGLVVISKGKKPELVLVDQADKRTTKLAGTKYDKCLHDRLPCKIMFLLYNTIFGKARFHNRTDRTVINKIIKLIKRHLRLLMISSKP